MRFDPNKLSIRVMKREDIEDIIRIDEQYVGYRREEYYKRKLEEVLDPKYRVVMSLVAEYDGKVIGFIMGSLFSGEFGIPENIASITTIGVDKSYTKHGVGKELLGQFITNAKAAGVERIYTRVEWSNCPLIKFFSASKFTPSRAINLELKV
jgi:predicted N-acetyltransferase YhbS